MLQPAWLLPEPFHLEQEQPWVLHHLPELPERLLVQPVPVWQGFVAQVVLQLQAWLELAGPPGPLEILVGLVQMVPAAVPGRMLQVLVVSACSQQVVRALSLKLPASSRWLKEAEPV